METFRQLFNSDAIAIFSLLKEEMESEIESFFFFAFLLCVTDVRVGRARVDEDHVFGK